MESEKHIGHTSLRTVRLLVSGPGPCSWRRRSIGWIVVTGAYAWGFCYRSPGFWIGWGLPKLQGWIESQSETSSPARLSRQLLCLSRCFWPSCAGCRGWKTWYCLSLQPKHRSYETGLHTTPLMISSEATQSSTSIFLPPPKCFHFCWWRLFHPGVSRSFSSRIPSNRRHSWSWFPKEQWTSHCSKHRLRTWKTQRCSFHSQCSRCSRWSQSSTYKSHNWLT